MAGAADVPPIRVANADGVLTYLIDLAPEALPPVRPRDLELAWDAAREAALAERWGPPRLFRFLRGAEEHTDLALADVDATAWAAAIDATTDMRAPAGVSLLMRLLALIDLLATAPWATSLFRLKRDGAELSPALLRAAATESLTREARFDPARFRAAVPAALSSGVAP